MDKKAQVPQIIGISIVAVIAIILVIYFIASTKFKFYAIGTTLIILAMFFGVKYGIDKGRWKFIGAFGLIGLALFLIPSLGVLQTALGTGNYIQAPTFYYYECAPATEPIESAHVTLTSGNSNGWITCPSNTDTCDLWVSQTEKTKWYSSDRSIIYQICHNNGANCDPQVRINAGSFILNQKQVPSVHLPNLLITDRVYINYQYNKLFGGWTDQANGAEYYQTYKPFILWKVDMFGGGRTEYTSISQGCNFLSGDTGGLINSVTNLAKQLNTQTSTSNTKLPFYKTRNFIGTYVPVATANVNFVTYNGQQGYCLNRQIFAISTVDTNGATYKIVDSNFNTRLANSVPCCPGETEPTRKCNSNFQWENIEQAECSAFKACAGADWMPSSSKTLIRYNCVNSKCVAETKAVACIYNSDCGNNQACDTKTYTCYTLQPGQPVPSVNNTQIECKWYQEPYQKNTKEYGFLYWRALFGVEKWTTTTGCKTAGWVMTSIIVSILAVAILIFLWAIIPKRRRRR